MHKVTLPNKIILYVIDTLRYDASRMMWPHFNIVFTQHYTSWNWTMPAMARLMTGRIHNGLNFYERNNIERIYDVKKGKLNKPTLGKYFKDKGYRTYAKTEGLYVSKHFGFGNEDEWDMWAEECRGDGSKMIKPEFIDDKKEFRFYHEYFVHDYFKDLRSERTYDELYDTANPEQKIGMFYWKSMEELYEWEEAYWNRCVYIADMMKWIKDSDALVIVTSDHGEIFHEFYGATGHTEQHMVDEIARVPLMIHWPGFPQYKRIDQMTRDYDILPTLLELIDHDAKLDGRGFLEVILENVTRPNIRHAGKYVHSSNQLWKYDFTPTKKELTPIKELPPIKK